MAIFIMVCAAPVAFSASLYCIFYAKPNTLRIRFQRGGKKISSKGAAGGWISDDDEDDIDLESDDWDEYTCIHIIF